MSSKTQTLIFLVLLFILVSVYAAPVAYTSYSDTGDGRNWKAENNIFEVKIKKKNPSKEIIFLWNNPALPSIVANQHYLLTFSFDSKIIEWGTISSSSNKYSITVKKKFYFIL